MKRLAIAVAIVAGLYLAWTWIDASPTLRYRLTLEVDVDGQTRIGSNVIEIRYDVAPAWLPSANRVNARVRGEAVAVDLGERGILFSLLRGDPDAQSPYVADAVDIPLRELKIAGSVGGLEPAVVRKAGGQTLRAEIPFSRLPLLVRFRDLADPNSVERVDPGNLAASFGPGARLRRVTIETTRDSVTTGIDSRLRWLSGLKTYLDGSPLHHSTRLANVLRSADFKGGT